MLSAGDAEAVASAIEAAAAVAPMPYRETAATGSTVHHLYVGLGTTTGVSAAVSVLAGLSPLSGTLERFFGPRAGAVCDFTRLSHGIDEAGRWHDYELMNAYIKVHPTCAHLHGVNDAIAQLIAEHGLRGQEVAGVEVGIYKAALDFENPEPGNDLAARFSVEASVAIALCRGELTVHTLTNENLKCTDVRELMSRIRVGHDPKLDDAYPGGRPCTVAVRCRDGRRLTASVVHPLGDCTNPLTREQRRTKARHLLGERFAEHAADDILLQWDAALAGEPLSCVSRALRSPAVNSPKSRID